jgi:hypothetical protein
LNFLPLPQGHGSLRPGRLLRDLLTLKIITGARHQIVAEGQGRFHFVTGARPGKRLKRGSEFRSLLVLEPMGRAEAERYGAARSRYWTWAALMRRAFDLDVLRCPRCAGRMQLIATIDDPAVIHCILAHLALPGARDDPAHPAAASPPRDNQPALPFALSS